MFDMQLWDTENILPLKFFSSLVKILKVVYMSHRKISCIKNTADQKTGQHEAPCDIWSSDVGKKERVFYKMFDWGFLKYCYYKIPKGICKHLFIYFAVELILVWSDIYKINEIMPKSSN